ncbi:hypothetical protein L596_012058 [Steinernema carpocapsae]|uniref:G-protein coupled receptors family 1 profile domain-containing protein n=1 Tax=Steinernema carpocapsae TaxID=34508 RepID=A0A4U5NWK1_STECR|nr:hypothetical protein L596_012058 [Steinernema carpocapsae]
MFSDKFSSSLLYGFFLICIPPGILFFYIALTKTPQTMLSYRNTLLNLWFWYYFTMVSFAILLQPVFVYRESEIYVKSLGLLSRIYPEFICLGWYISMFGIANIAASLVLCVLFRFAQLKFKQLHHFLHSCCGIICCIAVHLLLSFVLVFVMYIILSQTDKVEISNDLLLRFNIRHNSKVIIAIALLSATLCVAASILVILTCIIIQEMRKQRFLVTAKTYKLQKSFTISLILFTFIPLTLNTIPICFFAILLAFAHPLAPAMFQVASHLPFLDIFISCAITLVFIKPYRVALGNILKLKKIQMVFHHGTAVMH